MMSKLLMCMLLRNRIPQLHLLLRLQACRAETNLFDLIVRLMHLHFQQVGALSHAFTALLALRLLRFQAAAAFPSQGMELETCG